LFVGHALLIEIRVVFYCVDFVYSVDFVIFGISNGYHDVYVEFR